MDLVSIAMPGNSLFKSEQRDQLRLPDPVARTGMLHGAQWCMEGGLRRRRKLIPELIKRAACSEDGDAVRRELNAKQRGVANK